MKRFLLFFFVSLPPLTWGSGIYNPGSSGSGTSLLSSTNTWTGINTFGNVSISTLTVTSSATFDTGINVWGPTIALSTSVSSGNLLSLTNTLGTGNPFTVNSNHQVTSPRYLIYNGSTFLGVGSNDIQLTDNNAIGGNINLNPSAGNFVLINGSEIIQSSSTIYGSQGENVLYQISAGSFTGAGLSTCGDSTHALAWSSTNNQFSCQNVTGSSSGGGASTLATAIGSSTTWITQITSPTAAINLDSSQFQNALANGSTTFLTISYSTFTVSASYTMVSTNSVIRANCSSACTITLPDASNTFNLGRIFKIKIVGTGTTTIATQNSQTIDGSSTVTPNPNQNADIEVRSSGENYDID